MQRHTWWCDTCESVVPQSAVAHGMGRDVHAVIPLPDDAPVDLHALKDDDIAVAVVKLSSGTRLVAWEPDTHQVLAEITIDVALDRHGGPAEKALVRPLAAALAATYRPEPSC